MDSSTSPYVATTRNGATDLAATIAAQQMHEAATGAFIKTEAQLRKERRQRKKWTVAIATIAMTAFFVGLIAMIVEGSIYVYLAFVFPLVAGPYAVRQRRKLNKLPTLVYVMNQIREEVNLLMIQNTKLHVENNRLSNEIARLNEAEQKLQAVADKSGSNVATICDLVKENATTLRQMKQLQCAKELQSLLTAVLQSDANADHVLSPKELEMLLLRCQSFSVVDEVKLREALVKASKTNAVSTTALYNIAAASSFDNGDEAGNGTMDFTFGYGDWLFEEEPMDAE